MLISQVAVADTLSSMLKPEGKMQVGTSCGDDPFDATPLLGFLLSSGSHQPVSLSAAPPTWLLHPPLKSSAGKIRMGHFCPISLCLRAPTWIYSSFQAATSSHPRTQSPSLLGGFPYYNVWFNAQQRCLALAIDLHQVIPNLSFLSPRLWDIEDVRDGHSALSCHLSKLVLFCISFQPPKMSHTCYFPGTKLTPTYFGAEEMGISKSMIITGKTNTKSFWISWTQSFQQHQSMLY